MPIFVKNIDIFFFGPLWSKNGPKKKSQFFLTKFGVCIVKIMAILNIKKEIIFFSIFGQFFVVEREALP